MHEDVNQPERASPAEGDAAHEFAVYEYEEPPAPSLALQSVNPGGLPSRRARNSWSAHIHPLSLRFPKRESQFPLRLAASYGFCGG